MFFHIVFASSRFSRSIFVSFSEDLELNNDFNTACNIPTVSSWEMLPNISSNSREILHASIPSRVLGRLVPITLLSFNASDFTLKRSHGSSARYTSCSCGYSGRSLGIFLSVRLLSCSISYSFKASFFPTSHWAILSQHSSTNFFKAFLSSFDNKRV